MAGYTIEQLLRWSLDDRLIDSYTVDDSGNFDILRSGQMLHLTQEEARAMLLSLIRDGNGRSPRIEA